MTNIRDQVVELGHKIMGKVEYERWVKKPLKELDGVSPWSLMTGNKPEIVLHYLEDLASGQPE